MEKKIKKQDKIEEIGKIEAINTELEQKNKELKDTIDHLQRLQAEFQNYQKGVDKQIKMHKEYAAVDLVAKLLNVMDDFESAIKNLENENKEIVNGVKMIFSNLKKVLEGHGLREIKSLGEKFDPFKHEPIQRVNVEGKNENEVIEEIQKGYIFKEKILRPSKVKVASGEPFLEKKLREKTDVSLGGK